MTRRKSTQIDGLPDTAARIARGAIGALENAVLTREEWLRLAAQGSELGLWYWNEVTQGLFWDRRTREMFGVNPDGEVTVDTFYRALHPDDLAAVREVWRRQLETGVPCELEYRVLRPDGAIRWINARGSGFYDPAGKPRYMIGVVFDVTERKAAERERLELSGRLIRAQEKERKRLAREIHDDFCQRLSILAMGLKGVAKMTRETDAAKLVDESIASLSKLTNDIQSLSHRLYSSSLEILGLVPSIRSLCAEFAGKHGVEIEFNPVDVPDNLSTDTTLALFRIAQEGLRNVGKHSGASKVEVGLRADAQAIVLAVFDNGKGLSLSPHASAKGIGILSMRERSLSLGGRFEIRSRPSVDGTQITATVPITKAKVDGTAK
jgi:PAS domain S-box-containing protein